MKIMKVYTKNGVKKLVSNKIKTDYMSVFILDFKFLFNF